MSGAATQQHQSAPPSNQPSAWESALTVVASQAPSAGHTGRPAGEVVCGLGHTHGGHTDAQLGGARQLDERDVVVDGVAVVLWVFENLGGSNIPV